MKKLQKTTSKSLIFISIILVISSCAEANFDVKIESVPIDCFEIKNINTDIEHYLKLDRYASISAKLRLYSVEGNRKTKVEVVKGDFDTHRLQKEQNDKMREEGEWRLSFPSFSVFKTNNGIFFLEQRGMNNKLYVVEEQKIIEHFEK